MKNVKLDRETFVKLMTFIKTWTRYAEEKSLKLAEVLHTENSFCAKSEIGFVFEDMFCDPDSKDILMDIIIEAMDDTETDWINYYVYELEWGERNQGENSLKVYKEDGVTVIPLSTLDDLYNVLISEYNPSNTDREED